MGEKTCPWSELETKQPGQVCNKKIIKAKSIACDFSVKRVVTFGEVLYRNRMTRKFHFAELHIGCSIRYKCTLA